MLQQAAHDRELSHMMLEAKLDAVLTSCPYAELDMYKAARQVLQQLLATEAAWLASSADGPEGGRSLPSSHPLSDPTTVEGASRSEGAAGAGSGGALITRSVIAMEQRMWGQASTASEGIAAADGLPLRAGDERHADAPDQPAHGQPSPAHQPSPDSRADVARDEQQRAAGRLQPARSASDGGGARPNAPSWSFRRTASGKKRCASEPAQGPTAF